PACFSISTELNAPSLAVSSTGSACLASGVPSSADASICAAGSEGASATGDSASPPSPMVQPDIASAAASTADATRKLLDLPPEPRRVVRSVLPSCTSGPFRIALLPNSLTPGDHLP